MNLKSNTILITGGTSGIGFELAKQLLALGNTVLITGRDPKKLEAAKTKLPGAIGIQSDVSDPKAIEALFARVTKEFPKLNILINNAGVMKTVNMAAPQDLHELTREIDINFHGPVRMVNQFLPHLKRQPSAAIMNVSSGLAFTPLPSSPVYCATKAAIHSFTQSLRVQLRSTQVKVFELAPPATQTELLSDWDADDMKGISVMKVEALAKAAVDGLGSDRYEITPGQSSQLRFMSRLAPKFILGQMSKSVESMLAKI